MSKSNVLLSGCAVALFITSHVNIEFNSKRVRIKRVVAVTIDPTSGLELMDILLRNKLLPLYHLTSGNGRPPDVEHSTVIVDPSSYGPTRITEFTVLFTWRELLLSNTGTRGSSILLPFTRKNGSPGLTEIDKSKAGHT